VAGAADDDAYILDWKPPMMFDIGRVTLRCSASFSRTTLRAAARSNALPRMLLRLLPVKVLFTLALAVLVVLVVYGYEAQPTPWRYAGMVPIWAIGGLLVEFGWVGLLYGYLTWCWCHTRHVACGVAALAACAAPVLVNGNHYAGGLAAAGFGASVQANDTAFALGVLRLLPGPSTTCEEA
jgi:hypothetical protein